MILFSQFGDAVLSHGVEYHFIFAEHIENFRVIAGTQRTNQHRDGNFSVFINTDIENIVDIRFIFQPCAAERNDGSGECLFTCFIHIGIIIYTGRTNDLGNNDTLSAVDHKGTVFGHHGKIAHENFLFFDFTG